MIIQFSKKIYKCSKRLCEYAKKLLFIRDANQSHEIPFRFYENGCHLQKREIIMFANMRKIGTLITWLMGMSNDAGVLENVLMSPQKAKFKINI